MKIINTLEEFIDSSKGFSLKNKDYHDYFSIFSLSNNLIYNHSTEISLYDKNLLPMILVYQNNIDNDIIFYICHNQQLIENTGKGQLKLFTNPIYKNNIYSIFFFCFQNPSFKPNQKLISHFNLIEIQLYFLKYNISFAKYMYNLFSESEEYLRLATL